MGHFRVHFSFYFKARLRAESLLRVLDFICIEIRTNYHNKNSALRRALKKKLRGTGILKYRRIPVISTPDYKPTSLLIEISSRLYPCYTGYRIQLTIIRRYISDIFIIINQLQQRFFNRISMNRIPFSF